MRPPLRLLFRIGFVICASLAAKAFAELRDEAPTCASDLTSDGLSPSERAELNAIARESESIFDQGVGRVAVEIEGRRFFLERDSGRPRVVPDDAAAPRPLACCVHNDLLVGGLSKRILLMKKDLKRVAIDYQTSPDYMKVALRVTLRAQLNGEPTGCTTMYAVYHDEPWGWRGQRGTRRRIFDLISPRPFVISARTRETLDTQENLGMDDLEHVFGHRPPSFEPDLCFTLEGKRIKRFAPDPGLRGRVGRLEWFLSKHPTSWRPVRVVVFWEDGAALPEVVTAYFPRNEELLEMHRWQTTRRIDFAGETHSDVGGSVLEDR